MSLEWRVPAPAAMTPILEARSLKHAYPDSPAVLDGVDLTLNEGQRVALMGANGSGKTTLLLHLNGTLAPSEGEVRLRGRRMGYTRPELRAWRTSVGFVFQNPDDQLFAPTVEQDVTFGPLNLGLTDAEARDAGAWAMERMEVADLAARAPHELSFGQKKRVALAGVLAMRPEVLLLDEPTAGLDSPSCDRLLRTLADLNENGMTLLVATHEESLARSWAHGAVSIEQGRVLATPRGPDRALTTRRMVHAQVAVCLGCCCGQVQKGKPPVPVEALKAAWKENKLLKHVQLSISGCLGPCDVPNVVKVSSVRGQEWIGNIQDPTEYQALIDWAVRVKEAGRLLPLPSQFDARRFDPFRSA